MLIVTMNDIPGYEVEDVCGEVFGLTVRSRHWGSMFVNSRSIFGGELKGMTLMLAESRNQAIERLTEAAEAKGANAIISMRFDATEMGSMWTKICAYGTAVRARKIA